MRIVSGTLRGRNVKAPEGADTRPTTDRVREALFSSLFSLRGGVEDAVVLDAFAGSGALGFEALSRGARSVTFFERDKRAASIIAENIAAFKISPDQAKLVRSDVMRASFASRQQAFDLVFLDPPYATAPQDVCALIKRMDAEGALAPGVLIVYEFAETNRNEVANSLEEAELQAVTEKKYGKTGIIICREP